MNDSASPQDFGDFSILLVEDDEIMRLSLQDRLGLEKIPVVSAGSLAEARSALEKGAIDLIVTDIRLPDGTGRDLFESVSRHFPGLPVVLMTGFGSIPEAVEVVKAGAVDYLTKPFAMDAFVGLVRRLLTRISDIRQSAGMIDPDGAPVRTGSTVLGRSAIMRRLERLVPRVAQGNSSVLITGESGVGKEVMANLIHANSARAKAPFVKVNCAAIPAGLVESELFGHEKGAFTGADRCRIGRFEQAQGGTIFLDEIAEIPPETQVKLLRVLQERVVERVGGNDLIRLDVRVIAATQEDLKAAINAGRFRSDLYWRLNVIHIEIPPLRERPEDIPFLAERFITLDPRAAEKRITGLSGAALAQLLSRPLPGNARELRNAIERAITFCDGSQIEEHDLFALEPGGAPDEGSSNGPPALKAQMEGAEQQAIRTSLIRNKWAIAMAAEELGISRKTLWEKMRRYRIER